MRMSAPLTDADEWLAMERALESLKRNSSNKDMMILDLQRCLALRDKRIAQLEAGKLEAGRGEQ